MKKKVLVLGLLLMSMMLFAEKYRMYEKNSLIGQCELFCKIYIDNNNYDIKKCEKFYEGWSQEFRTDVNSNYNAMQKLNCKEYVSDIYDAKNRRNKRIIMKCMGNMFSGIYTVYAWSGSFDSPTLTLEYQQMFDDFNTAYQVYQSKERAYLNY